MKRLFVLAVVTASLTLGGCFTQTQEGKDADTSEEQQKQLAKRQPVPTFDWSLERELLISLYHKRNHTVSTHSVWRSDYGMLEGDCPSMGYGLPYDTSLTNPKKLERRRIDVVGADEIVHGTVEQAEPNGIFASKNSTATWVMCLEPSGGVEPVFTEANVTVYSGPVSVNYETNRVKRIGPAAVIISTSAPKQ